METGKETPFMCYKRRRKATPKKNEQRDEKPGPVKDQVPPAAEPGISVSEFDYSVENHFKFVETMTELCGYPNAVEETKRFSNSITFLREWRDFNYKPQVVKFAFQRDEKENDVIGGIKLPQFSAASVPLVEASQNQSGVGAESCKDFVMNVGGSVWALDWCPKIDYGAGTCINSEFVAVAAHPPDSSYHKIGAPLTGRGAVQIWCMLTDVKDEPDQAIKGKKRSNTQRKGITISNEVPRGRGRPRKKPLCEPAEKIDPDYDHTLVKVPEPRSKGRPRKKSLSVSIKTIDHDNAQAQPAAIENPKASPECRSSNRQIKNEGLPFLRQCEHGESAPVDRLKSKLSVDSPCPDMNIASTSSSKVYTSKNSIPIDFVVPRLIFCLAHNGKVAWDVKWRPIDVYHPKSDYIMGYLAVLLGNGALEVWEVPLPHTVQYVYPAFQEDVDPRFIKLRPVFRCSMLKCGDRRSIPLTMEWSASSPYDMILAGCHDGMVAVWKFSVSDLLTDTRPLLFFSADLGPIRSLSWAPDQSDLQSAYIIVTAGYKGLKFWDLRDPFRALWEHSISLVTYALEWLPDPRCIYGSTEDGTMWLLGLEKAAHDLPLSKKCHYLASKHGFHQLDCSRFSLWSLHASPLTGMVAYCGEEGSIHCFKPSLRSLNDPSRNRLCHYLCGSLLEEGNAIVVASPFPSSSFQSRYPSMRTTIRKSNAKEGTSGEKEIAFERFPPKIVAMHRVRWNGNKGMENWICYGGAAGLLRCQQLHIS